MTIDSRPAVTPGTRGRYPARMRSIRHVLGAAGVGVLAAALLAACGGSSGPSAATGGSPSNRTPSASTAPLPVDSEPPIAEPSDSAGPGSSASLASEPPPSGTAPASETPSVAGPAAACTGSDNNREFFAAAAAALSFDVYCPVLPSGWFVSHGEYHLASGGRLEISYRGPGGATLELVERGPCQAGDDCIPDGTQEGKVAFGGRPATQVALDEGRVMVVAQAAGDGTWWIIGDGIDATAVSWIAADVALVAD